MATVYTICSLLMLLGPTFPVGVQHNTDRRRESEIFMSIAENISKNIKLKYIFKAEDFKSVIYRPEISLQ